MSSSTPCVPIERLRAALHQTRPADSEAAIPSVLVLCRTGAQADALRCAVALAGGLPGVAVETPRSFVLTAVGEAPQGAHAQSPERPSTSWLLRQVGAEGERPLLEARVAGWASALRLFRAAGGEIPAGVERLNALAEVADSGWGADALERSVLSVLGGLARRQWEARRGSSSTTAFDAVYSIGYPAVDHEGRWGPAAAWERDFAETWGGDPEVLCTPLPTQAWERALLAALGAVPLLGSQETAEPGPLTALEVPDVTAEARLAVLCAARSIAAGRTPLVLVPTAADAARVRCFGRGNGLAVADSEGVLLSQHPLAPVLRVALAWFAPVEGRNVPDPILRASHLERVLTAPVVGRHFPGAMATALARRIADRSVAAGRRLTADEPLAWSVRARREAIRACRITEAPLSRWRARLQELVATSFDGADPDRTFERWRTALLLQARLERLAHFVTGAPEVVEAAAEPPMADAPVSSAPHGEDRGLVGPEEHRRSSKKAELPAAGTLGALRGFLLDIRLRVYDDPVGKAILAALLEAHALSATPANLAQVLAGEGGAGRLVHGLEVHMYDDYDGRVTDDVLLLGVHDKGIAAPPAADPVLPPGALRVLGFGAPRDRVLFRLLQAQRAAARAVHSALAIVSQRDAAGRAVVAPVELRLRFDGAVMADLDPGSLACDSFGLGISTLPETRDRQALLAVSPAPPDPSPPPGHASELGALALQASAEWVRHGRGPVPGIVPRQAEASDDGDATSTTTLADVLEGLGSYAPAELLPYLGAVGDDLTPGLRADGSPRPWSVSRDFEPLTNCLYRYFVERVLNIHEDEPSSDELDPREVGNAVHSALEHANPPDAQGVHWRAAEGEDLEAARAAAQAVLIGNTEQHMREAQSALGHLSPAVEAASAGLKARWQRNWGGKQGEAWTGYVASRIQGLDALERTFKCKVDDEVAALPEVQDLLHAALGLLHAELGLLSDRRPTRLQERRKVTGFLVWLLQRAADGFILRDVSDDEVKELAKQSDKIPQKYAAALTPLIGGDAFGVAAAAVARALPGIKARNEVLAGSQMAVEVELPFGEAAGEWRCAGQAALLAADLEIDGRSLAVTGKVDRVLVIAGAEHPSIQILDYKSGKVKKRKELVAGMRTLALPQLPVYALVLRRLLARADESVGTIPVEARVACLGYDYLREPGGAGLVGDHVVDDVELDRLEAALDHLVARARDGRWWPVPLDDDENGKASWGYPRGPVPLRDAARFEAMPAPPSLGAGDTIGEETE